MKAAVQKPVLAGQLPRAEVAVPELADLLRYRPEPSDLGRLRPFAGQLRHSAFAFREEQEEVEDLVWLEPLRKASHLRNDVDETFLRKALDRVHHRLAA